MFKEFFKEYYQFTRSERIGTIVLILLIILVLAITIVIPRVLPKQIVDFSEFQRELEQWETTGIQDDSSNSTENSAKDYKDKNSYQLFIFNPNTVTEDEMKLLGLNNRIVNTLLKYRNKGGVFYKNEDVKKIYGMNDSIFAVIDPYIFIPIKEKPKQLASDTIILPLEEFKKFTIEINNTDSVSLLKLYGIGPVYAGRIIKYRNLLGGYVRKDQLLEVYGITSETYDEIENNIVLNGDSINKININTATFEQLNRHPYLNSYQANAILEYRNIQGEINFVGELVDNKLLPDEVFQKIKPYLKAPENQF